MRGNAGTRPAISGTAIMIYGTGEQRSEYEHLGGRQAENQYNFDINIGAFSREGRTLFSRSFSPSDHIWPFFGQPPAQHPRSAFVTNQVSTETIRFPSHSADLFLDLVKVDLLSSCRDSKSLNTNNGAPTMPRLDYASFQ